MMAYFLSLFIMLIFFFMNRTPDAAANQWSENPLTSHVLDTGTGLPAAGVAIDLYKLSDTNKWDHIILRETDKDGRISNLLSAAEFTPGMYKFRFDTKSYYDKTGQKTFFPYIDLVFDVDGSLNHYHVPILLSPFGFTTYRGS